MAQEFIRIEPSNEVLIYEDIVTHLEGLRKIADSAWRRYNPLRDPPKFVFMITTHGDNEPIKFYFGTEDGDHLESLKNICEVSYPNSFDIHIETVNLVEELNPDSVLAKQQGEGGHKIDPSSVYNAGRPEDFSKSHVAGVHWYGRGERRADWMTLTKRFTQLTKRHQRQKEGTERRERSAPVADLVEAMNRSDHPVAFQVVFARRRAWPLKLKRRKAALQNGVDGPLAAFGAALGAVFEEPSANHSTSKSGEVEEGSDSSEQREDTGEDLGSRINHIDRKGSTDCYRVNLRAIGSIDEEASEEEKQQFESEIQAVADSFNHLSGQYYNITGRKVKDGLREQVGKRPTPDDLLDDFLSYRIRKTYVARTRLQLILNNDELANYIACPSNTSLTAEGVRGTRGQERTKSPLSLPDPDTMSSYMGEGVPIGYPIKDSDTVLDEPIRIPPSLLNDNFLLTGTIGHGKTMAGENILLGFHRETSGPNVIIDPKDGAFASNYLREHYRVFGSLEDVIYFRIPETIPAAPFFDIRPLRASGYGRRSAIQDKVDQFVEIMKVVMEEGKFQDAPNSVTLLKSVIKLNFDERYGEDAFTLRQVRETIMEIAKTRQVPHVSPQNSDIQADIQFLLNNEEDQFSSIVQGALNRLKVLYSYDPIKDMLNYVPEWGERRDGSEGYIGNGFSLRELFDQDKTVIIDLGEPRDKPSKAISLILTSYFFDMAKQKSHRDNLIEDLKDPVQRDDDYIATLMIDEAKDVADADFVSDLLAQGREFRVCTGLIMQFPEQVREEGIEADVYDEIIQNIGTKILGKNKRPGDIAEVLSGDEIDADEQQNRLSQLSKGEWIVTFVDADFFGDVPEPFSLHSLPPPPGHDLSDHPYSDEERRRFVETVLQPRVQEIQQQYCVPLNRQVSEKPAYLDQGDNITDQTGSTTGDQNSPSAAKAGSYSGAVDSDNSWWGRFDESEGDQEPASPNQSASTTNQPSDSPSDSEPPSSSGSMSSRQAADRSGASNPLKKPSDPSTGSSDDGHEQSGESGQQESSATDGGAAVGNIGPNEKPADDASSGANESSVVEGPLPGENGDELPGGELGVDDISMEEELQDAQASRPDEFATESSDQSERFPSNAMNEESSRSDQPEASTSQHDSPAANPLTKTDNQSVDQQQTDSEQTEDQSYHGIQRLINHLSDQDLQEWGITYDDARFLAAVMKALHEDIDGYSLDESMSTLPYHKEADIDRLESAGLLDERRVAYKWYYSLTWDATDLLDTQPPLGPGRGDLGEKTPHRVGVYAGKQLIETKTEGRVERYYKWDEDTTFDLGAFDQSGEIRIVAEVETKSHNRDAIVSDYDKMAQVEAKAYWIVDSHSTAKEIIATLQNRRNAYPGVSPVKTSYSNRRAEIRDSADDPDRAQQIYGVHEIFNEL